MRTRNFRLFLAGQVVSASGNWMQKIAQAWLVLQLTGSGTMLGVVAGLQELPVLLIGPLAGVAVDRANKRRLLICTQSAMGALALTLFALTASDLIELWMLLVLAALLGIVDAIDKPTRLTFISEMVDTGNLMNAVSLNAVVMNVSKSLGPSIAGIVIATAGVPASFLFNAISFGAVVLGLTLMRNEELYPSQPTLRERGQFRAGLRHVRSTPNLAGPLLLLAAAGMLAYEWQTTLPLFATDTFEGDARTFGLMFSAMGVGAVLGGLFAASNEGATMSELVRWTWIFSGVVLLLSVAPSFPAALVILILVGAASSVLRANGSTLLQTQAGPQFRGRIMALQAAAVSGSTPIGGPLVGAIGERFGARFALAFGGLGTALALVGIQVWMSRRAGRFTVDPTAPVATCISDHTKGAAT